VKKSKLFALAVGMLACGTIGANADIGFTFQGRGGYLPGGDFNTGPWPEVGAYYQVLWSATDPTGNVVDQRLSGENEVVLLANFTVKPYGYFDPTPLIVVTDAQVPDVNTTGFVYTRLYDTGTPTAGSYYAQSPAVPNSSLPVYDNTNPGTIAALLTPVGAELSGVVVPEPATGMLLAFSGLLLAVVRRRRMAR